MDLEKKPVVSDVGAWAMNVISSVGIIMANKQLMSLNGYAFCYATTLTGFHFCVTALVGWISNATGLSVSNKHYSSRVILAEAVVAGICTVTDVDINDKGLLCACVAVFSTSLQQIFFILLSCALAVFCNTSQYLCIGRFSTTSFQVLGHMKTVCVLILGWILFDSSLTLKNILGMLLAVLGMVAYSWAIESEKQVKLPTHINADSKLAGEDVMLLKEKVNGLPEANQHRIWEE